MHYRITRQDYNSAVGVFEIICWASSPRQAVEAILKVGDSRLQIEEVAYFKEGTKI